MPEIIVKYEDKVIERIVVFEHYREKLALKISQQQERHCKETSHIVLIFLQFVRH